MSGWNELVDAVSSLGGSTIRLSVPLIFAAMGGLLSERSGVINIVLEGKMLIGAFVAGAVTYATGDPWAGWWAAGAAGALMGVVYAGFAIGLRANQIVTGTAMNMLALGIPPFVAKILYDATGSTPALEMSQRFVSAPVWIAFGVVIALAAWLRWTRWGLRLSFAGEHPEALKAAGIRPIVVRYWAVVTAGVLAGFGGATLSICLSSSYSRNMTAGRGFIALAALILGGWRPIPAMAACLLFGFSEAIQMRLQGVVLWGSEPVPVQFIQMVPYLLTILVLAGFMGRSRAPRDLGNA